MKKVKLLFKSTIYIYIHIPYCKSQCPYCAFFKQVGNREDLTDFFLRDLDSYETNFSEFEVKSIYFGGGTPSLFSASFFEKIINKIGKKISLNPSVEITIEINPNTLKTENLRELKQAGITRPSFGIQAFNEKTLQFLGRSHTKKQALNLLQESSKIFDTFSADFIYGLPDQKEENWGKELAEILKFQIPHLSLYSLSLESGTPFFRKFSENDLDDGELYEQTKNLCETAGYLNYEISNFAKTETDFSQHNLAYWLGKSYLGLGASAHGRLEISPKKWISTEGISNISKWKKDGLKQKIIMKKDRAEEIVLMFLRTTFGLKEDFLLKKTGMSFSDILDLNKIKKAVKNNFIIYKNNEIKTTKLGRQFLNSVLKEILKLY
ncbi:MAG: radical SAM family heme chaperone HemW [Alphaproteobacteria bacterium]